MDAALAIPEESNVPQRMGRPTTLSQKVAADILGTLDHCIDKGLVRSRTAICQAAGVNRSTMEMWIARLKADEIKGRRLKAFVRAFLRAEAQMLAVAEDDVAQAKDPRVKLDLMKAQRPGTYSERRLKHQVEHSGQVDVKAYHAVLGLLDEGKGTVVDVTPEPEPAE